MLDGDVENEICWYCHADMAAEYVGGFPICKEHVSVVWHGYLAMKRLMKGFNEDQLHDFIQFIGRLSDCYRDSQKYPC